MALAWFALTLPVGAISITAVSAPLPGGFAHSGWYQFEVVVLVNTRTDTLESETWPLVPAVTYPARWRWLQDQAGLADLADAYPDSVITNSPSGHLSIVTPAPPPPPWQAPPELLTEGDLAVIDELMVLAEGSDTSARRLSELSEPSEYPLDSDAELRAPEGPVLPFEAAPVNEQPSPLVALESLGIAGPSTSPEAPNVAVPFALPSEIVRLEPIKVSARAIPLPKAFIEQSLDQLARGLARYRRGSEDDVVASVSWLQGPESGTLPILLEADESSSHPLVQGFIQLLPRGKTWRLGLNFWANTPGHYLPEIFEMPGPPPSPQRLSIISADSAMPIAQPDPDTALNLGVSAHTNPLPAPMGDNGRDAVAVRGFGQAVLPADAVSVSTAAGATGVDGDYSRIPTKPQWPSRHVIHVADTVPLSEGRLRYYDHPVIKVLAIWRELSWYEVFRQGKDTLNASKAPLHDSAKAQESPAVPAPPGSQR
jgi:hypothetical protein